MTASVVDAVEGVGAAATDVGVVVLGRTGRRAEGFDAAGEKFDHVLAGDKGGLGLGGGCHGFWVGGKLELGVVQDLEEVRAVGQREDVEGQREAGEEGEEQFHGVLVGTSRPYARFFIQSRPLQSFQKTPSKPPFGNPSQPLGRPNRPLWLALGGVLTAKA